MSDDPLARMVALLAEKGSPVGRLKGAVYGVLLSENATSLPLKTHALVLLELATKFAFAAGMSFDEFNGCARCGYQQAVTDAQLPPPVAPEPGSDPSEGRCRECGGPSGTLALCDECTRRALEP